jgi:rhodanese-related sulfurtransferase
MSWLSGSLGAGKTRQEVDVTEAKRRHGGGALLIDVRERDEWFFGHAPGATQIALGCLSRHIAELPRDRDLLLICRSGNRSGTAQEALVRQGFTRAVNVSGGMLAWTRAGLPTNSGD